METKTVRTRKATMAPKRTGPTLAELMPVAGRTWDKEAASTAVVMVVATIKVSTTEAMAAVTTVAVDTMEATVATMEEEAVGMVEEASTAAATSEETALGTSERQCDRMICYVMMLYILLDICARNQYFLS